MIFTEFKILHKTLYNIELDDAFLSWLVGFFEGDGLLVMTHRGDIHFVISQHATDLSVLKLIKDSLGFGAVYRQGENVHRYMVQDKKNLELICLLLNGNLVFPSRRMQFSSFLVRFNKLNNKNMVFNNRQGIFSYNDEWFTGLTDSEGCFSVTIKKYPIIRFSISQKGEENSRILTKCIHLFGVGRLDRHSKKGVYTYAVDGLKATSSLLKYFDINRLKTRKAISYNQFRLLHGFFCNNEHKRPERRAELIRVAKSINKW